MPTECDHIIGFSEGVDEAWLTEESRKEKDKGLIEQYFNYCPKCGEKLDHA